MARNIVFFDPFRRMKCGTNPKRVSLVAPGHALSPCSQGLSSRPATQRRIPPDSEASTVLRPP